MAWWGWMVIGALLLAAEMGLVDAEFYLVLLGVSALLVGLVGLAGVDAPVWAQWLLFGALALVSLVFFRSRVYGWTRGADRELAEGMVGDFAVAQESIAPGATGRAELRGSVWTAQNIGSSSIEAGSRVRVERSEGLLLQVRGDAPTE